MAASICPRAEPERSPLNFLMSSLRLNRASVDTSAFDSGCRLTSKLPVALFIFETSFCLLGVEMRVFDDAEHIAPGIEHVGGANIITDVRDIGARLSSELEQPGMRAVDVRNTPINTHRAGRGIGQEPQLVPADIEADVERLVEIRCQPQDLGVPALALGNVRRAIDRRAQP